MSRELLKQLKYILPENFSRTQLNISNISKRCLTSHQTPTSHLQAQTNSKSLLNNPKKRSFSFKNDKLSISQEEVKRKKTLFF